MKIESTDKDIRTLLSSGYYKIPRFQRPYSWDRENISEFWNDVVQDNPGEYFIGSMVVFKDANRYYGIVDGQQRLTTITVLLCVLRNTLNDLGFHDLAEGIHGLIERKNIDNKPEFILSPETSYPFFQDHIQKWGIPDLIVTPLNEEQNLQRADKQLEELVGGIVHSIEVDTSISDEDRPSYYETKLKQIRDALLDLKLIFIELDNEDNAYLIFETLNTRGKDLSISDLVKNHLTKHLRSRSVSVDQSKIKWTKLLETIEGSSADLNTDTFIHHFWLSRYDYLPAKKLFKSLKKRIKKADAKNFLDALVSDAQIYRSIHETSFGNWTKQETGIQRSLDALMLFRVKQQTPCVLSLVRKYRDDHIKKKHLEDAVVAIEKFHFLFTAITSQRSSGGISAMYASLARRLFETTDIQLAVDIIRDIKDKLRNRIPSVEEVKALFPEIIYTNNFTKQRKLVKYILAAFHRYDNATGIATDYDQMTIEHLRSQSEIGNSDLNDSIIGQIGNLILVTEELNQKLKAKPFEEKKRILKDDGFPLPQEIEEASEWNESNIINRTQMLAELAYNEVWRI